MSGSLAFLAWTRSGIYDLANPPGGNPQLARLPGSVALRLEERDGPGSAQRAADFQIMGPGDVKALARRAVVRMVPAPNSSNAETTLSVHVELAAADLPWRFTPQEHANKHLRPWITLVVGTAAEPGIDDGEVEILPENFVRLRRPVLEAQPLSQAAKWAHVQVALSGDHPDIDVLSTSQLNQLVDAEGGKPVARLLSPRQLARNRLHIAAIVPVFQANGQLWWDINPPNEVVVPVYRWWQFRTGDAGDFRTLAARLRAAQPDPADGQAAVTYNRIEPAAEVTVRGALGPVGGVDSVPDQTVVDDLDGLTSPPTDERGRPVIGLPIYGSAWNDDPKQTTWGQSANTNPGYRGGAGLGADAGIELQDTIVETVKKQIGAVSEAGQRINQLVAGLQAAGTLWNQRLPASPQHRLMLFGPTMRRMATANGSVLSQVAGGERPMPPALFSSAARRLLRYGPARTALAKPGAASPEVIIDQANTCLPLPEARPANGSHVDDLTDILGLPPLVDILNSPADLDKIMEALDQFFNKLPGSIQGSSIFLAFWESLLSCIQFAFENGLQFDFIGLAELLVTLFEPQPNLDIFRGWNCEDFIGPKDDSLDGLEDDLNLPPPDRPCSPVDIDTLDEDLTTAIDPTSANPWIVEVVLDGIEGLPDPPLAPVEICTGVDLPAWRFLRDRHPDWLLPGVGQLKDDSVFAFESNSTFVEAFLLGLNTQVMSELRWRNVPIASGCTPLKMFWGRVDVAQDARINDVIDVTLWDAGSSLGDPGHFPGGGSTNLVLLVRSDLVRRYPATLVSAVEALQDNGQPVFGPGHEPPDDAPRTWPIFQGSIGEDVTFFGFDLTPEQARGYWLILEEPASGYRFRADVGPTANNGGDYAAQTLNIPTRVLISGAELIPE
ncbi:MAG: hypothetical protein H6649_01155 [Caldilineae bacterium]|nr:hypothetical protein [Caldilineae bacterium]